MEGLNSSKNKFMPEESRIKEHLKRKDVINWDKFLKCTMVEPHVKFELLRGNIILDHTDQVCHPRNNSCQDCLHRFSIKSLLLWSVLAPGRDFLYVQWYPYFNFLHVLGWK